MEGNNVYMYVEDMYNVMFEWRKKVLYRCRFTTYDNRFVFPRAPSCFSTIIQYFGVFNFGNDWKPY